MKPSASKNSSANLSLLVLLFITQGLRADDLLYVYGPECGACRKFQSEAGAIYPKTEAAEYMPMIKVTLEDWQAGRHPLNACATKPVYGTPTFLQIADCREVDRITGYSNDELFWFALERMLNRSKGEE